MTGWALRRGAWLAATAMLLCAGCGERRDASGQRLRVAVAPFLSYGPLFIAADEGFFAAEGLDVEFVMLSTNDANAAVAHGDVDVVANFLSAGLFNAIGRGGRIALVADKGHEAAGACVTNGLVIRSSMLVDGQLPDIATLRGRSLDIRVGGVEEYWVERLFARSGLSIGDLNLRQVPWNAKSEALRAGGVDLTAWSEPNLTRTVESGDGAVLAGAGDVMPEGQWAFMLFGESLLGSHRELGVRFMTAYLAGVHEYNQGKTPRNVEILARGTGLDEGLVRRACWMRIRLDGRIDVESVMEFQRWALGRGYLDELIEPERFWDPSFVEEAARRLEARTRP